MKLARDNVIDADLSGLTQAERVNYYLNVCAMFNLDPATYPLEYVIIDGGLRLAIKSERPKFTCNVRIPHYEMARIFELASDQCRKPACSRCAEGNSFNWPALIID